MDRFQTNQELIFVGTDLSRPRMAVEREKMAILFPGFKFYGSSEKINSVKGYLNTNFDNRYYVKIEISDRYPYEIPKIVLPNNTLDHSSPHTYGDKEICVMKPDRWTSTFSLAFMVAKAAIWLNKYDHWKSNGRDEWPGKGH